MGKTYQVSGILSFGFLFLLLQTEFLAKSRTQRVQRPRCSWRLERALQWRRWRQRRLCCMARRIAVCDISKANIRHMRLRCLFGRWVCKGRVACNRGDHGGFFGKARCPRALQRRMRRGARRVAHNRRRVCVRMVRHTGIVAVVAEEFRWLGRLLVQRTAVSTTITKGRH
jgi:hypothetical protein